MGQSYKKNPKLILKTKKNCIFAAIKRIYMKKVYLLLLTLFLVLGTNESKAQSKKYSVYGIGVSNLENIFNHCHDAAKKDHE